MIIIESKRKKGGEKRYRVDFTGFWEIRVFGEKEDFFSSAVSMIS